LPEPVKPTRAKSPGQIDPTLPPEPAAAAAALATSGAAQGASKADSPQPASRADDAASPLAIIAQASGVGPADKADSRSDYFYYRIAVVHLIANVVGAILTPVLLAVALVVALKRLRPLVADARLAPELAFDVPFGESRGARRSANEGAGPAAFDLGPSYEDERRKKEEAEREQQEALLRHLYEQNLDLRDQLAGLGDAPAA
jgi:hypothetical protein